ncbi:KpsF/GutQ family sugar-phosphate isomerase [Chrysiogenes arsenatis]|uniref:KpsF/GutQ family sugar-phosphate isomerase n=1 Tax=Chrysiogenes arsenatis TaxID=309797 RepID=UPI00041E50FE|nr:KpsF/GutQ family sugar-phosphate isomerase [Chrysiogenes arsenatis]
MPSSLASAQRTIDIEIAQLQNLRQGLDTAFERAVDILAATRGKVVVTGMGKSGIIAKKIAATMASTGTSAFFMHPSEGLHGDLGMIMKEDSLIAISNSGTTNEVLQVINAVKRQGIPVIGMSAVGTSRLAEVSDVCLNLCVKREACPHDLAPTSSTTNTLVLGDALAIALLERKQFTPDDFAFFHPSGALGKRLLTRVSDVMHSAEKLPLRPLQATFSEVVYEMSAKGFGVVGILSPHGELAGLITDGDLRRLMQQHGAALFDKKAEEIMNRTPKRIAKEKLATEALAIMEKHSITSLFCVDSQGCPEGFIHLHQLLREGIA